MRIIIDSKQKDLDHLQGEMALLQKELAEQQHMPNYADLDSHLNKRLDKFERSVIFMKKHKHTRDQLGYDKDKVYIWKKPSFRSNRP